MFKNFRLFFLSYLVICAFFVSGISCTPEGPKEISMEETPKAEHAKDKEAVPVEESSKSKSPLPASETQDTKKESPTTSKAANYPAEIVLQSSLWKTHTRGPVQLTHKKHIKDYRVPCTECHHVFKGDKNIWEPGMPVDKCHVCHNETTVKGEKSLPPGSRIRNLKLAFHKNCQGCHRNLKAENPDSKAPTVCSKCHEKKDNK